MAYEKRLTDKFYLIAGDSIDEMSIGYQSSGTGYTVLIGQTVFAVGYNDGFIIAKRHPREFPGKINKDSTFYHIIEVRKVIKARNNFISKVDTFTYRNLLKDKSGKDSSGPEKTQIFNSYYNPDPPERLTLEKYLELRRTLSIRDSLDFTITFKELK